MYPHSQRRGAPLSCEFSLARGGGGVAIEVVKGKRERARRVYDENSTRCGTRWLLYDGWNRPSCDASLTTTR